MSGAAFQVYISYDGTQVEMEMWTQKRTKANMVPEKCINLMRSKVPRDAAGFEKRFKQELSFEVSRVGKLWTLEN